MKYVYCVVIPLLLQLAVVGIVIVLNTGNGSWLGLAAFLLAIPVVPLTAIINIARTKAHQDKPVLKLFGQAIIVALVVPAVILLFFVASSLMEGLVNRHF